MKVVQLTQRQIGAKNAVQTKRRSGEFGQMVSGMAWGAVRKAAVDPKLSIHSLAKECGLIEHRGYVGTERDFDRMRQMWD